MFRTFAVVVAMGLMSSAGIADASDWQANDNEPKDAAHVQVVAAASSGEVQSGAEAGAEEEEAPESAVSSPPMEMDDPGTPGRQGIEVNLVGTLARAGQGRGSETLLDANYGIGDRIQLKFERPYLTEGAVGEHNQQGLGATEIGVKWRFLDNNGLEAAVYPNYSFNDGFTLKDEEGNPESDEGSSYYLPLLISKTVHRDYTLAVNLGYRHNLDHELQDTTAAFGVGRAIGEYIRVLTEIYSERDENLHNRQTDVRVGWVEALFPKALARSKMEFVGFASIGHSVGHTEEGEASTTFAFGVSVIKKPKGEI